MEQVKLQCRPELLQQWKDDAARNPEAFAALMSMSPMYLQMLVHDAAAAASMSAAAAAARAPDFYQAIREMSARKLNEGASAAHLYRWIRMLTTDAPDACLLCGPGGWERRQAHGDGNGGLRWGDWKPCAKADADRVTGLRTWQVRRTLEPQHA